MQRKSILKSQILAELITLEGLGWDNQVDITRNLGYEKDVLSRVKTEDNYFGSPQLLAGLKLLRELTILRQEESMKNRLLEIQKIKKDGGVRYPDQIPSASFLNAPATPADEASSTGLAEDAARKAGVAYDVKRKKKPKPS